MKKFTFEVLCALLILLSGSLDAQNVWTQHNDQGRTGWYPYETTLNQSNVNQNNFGIKFSQAVDQKIVAQPLVMMNVNIPNKGIKNVVYVATQNNTVYAFDADVNTVAYWQTNFTNSITPGGSSCTNCRPVISDDIHPSLCGGGYGDFEAGAPMGIVGTPVIDTVNGIIFFVTKIVNMNDGPIDNHTWSKNVPFDEYSYTLTGFHQYLHAVDITNGVERPNSPVEIKPTYSGSGDGQTSPGLITFNPRGQFNRSGLALNNGTVYIAFAAHCDNNPSHGWIVSYDANTLELKNSFMTTPNDGRGGIWMSGVGPAIDASGNIYITNGNSLNESGTSTEYHKYNSDPSIPANRGEGIVKLAPDLTLSDYFTPYNYIFLNNGDLDFSAQVMLLPKTNLAVAGCKDDSLYVFDRGSLGHFDKFFNHTFQRVFVNGTDAEMHSTLAYFGGTLPYAYQYSEDTHLQQYSVDPTTGLTLFKTNTAILIPNAGVGGFLSTSSNGSDPVTGILWAYQPITNCATCSGTLYALDANDVTHQLWNSDMVPADNITIYNKFSCPTIALGKVYAAANRTQLAVYGEKPNTSCSTNQALNKNATALTNNNLAGNITDGNPSTSWTGLPQDVDSIYIDLGGSYDVCKVVVNWDASGFGKDFDMKISNDGVSWTTIKSFRGNTVTSTEFDGAVTGRFVSMVGITRGTTSGYSINEFQVFGQPSAACPPLTGLNASPGTNVSIFTTQTPTGNPGQDAPVELGVKFRSSVAGYITGIRFYKTSGYTGTHIGELYSYPGGVRLAQVTFTGETASGWQTMSFVTPVAITANTTYIAAFYDQSGYYVADNNGLATSITNNNLTALANGTDGTNGVYAYAGAPTFPTTTFMSSNYWVDPIFSINLTADPHSQLLTWDASPGSSQYIIKYRPSLSQSWINRTSATNGIVVSALSCNTLYDYMVQADCGGGQQSVISQGSFIPTGCAATSCDALPAGYYNVDLGDIGQAGSTCFKNNVYTLTGSGTDIGGNADGFQFAYTSLDIADYEVYGRIIQQDASPATNKIGVMVRDSLTNTSRFAYLYSQNSGSSFFFEYRAVAGGPVVTSAPIPGPGLPYWVQVRKVGTTYSAFTSPDNMTWTKVAGPVDLHFGNNSSNPPHYGMAETSANNSALASGQIDNFTVTGSIPLPIRLVAFSAKNINEDHVLVSWSTSMEHLVDHFEVERSVDNGHFAMIAKVKAAGESEIVQNYSVNDNNPVSGVNYYRLKEIDKDGKYYYSPIVWVKFNGPEGLEMYPNPAVGYTSIKSLKYPIVEVSLYGITGQLLQNIHSTNGQTIFILNTAELAQGVYIVQVKTTKGLYRQKLFRQ